MTRDFIRIAHLSDLHFSADQSNVTHGAVTAVKDDLSHLKPDLIVVTGDIADNTTKRMNKSDLRKSLTSAKDFLESLCRTCNCDLQNGQERLFVVPGNHDYRYWGILDLRFKGYPKIFVDIFKDYFQSRYIPDINLVVGCFDSNTTKAKINFATGEVLRNEFNKFTGEMDKWKESSEKFAETKKIALLHHHPMPVYRAEAGGKFLESKKFSILENGATFMREMMKHDIKLIFHGHEHQRGVAKASFPIPGDSNIFGTIGVISAASIGKKENGEYSYNIVDYYNDGRVTVDHRILRGEATYEPEGKPVELFDYREARHQSFQTLNSEAPTIVRRVVYECKISEDTGDSEGFITFEDWTSNKGPCPQLETHFKSESGVFFYERPSYNVVKPPQNQKIEWIPKEPPKGGLQKGVIKFDPPLNKEPVTAHFKMKIPNAFFFTQEDRKAVTQPPSIQESVYRTFTKISAEQMILKVQFPPAFEPINPRIDVTDRDGNPQPKEREHCQKSFCYSKMLNCAFLSVDFPLLKRIYKIIWDLPSEADVKAKVPPSALGASEEIKECLLSLSNSGDIRSFLKSLYQDLINTEFLRMEESVPPLEVGIIAYDPKEGKLRYVAHYCPKITDYRNCGIWNERVIKGQPFSGLAFRRNAAIIGLYPQGPPDTVAQYIRKPICLDHKYFTAIVAIPLTFPPGSENVVVVLELASCSNTSGLLKLGDGAKNEQIAKRLALYEFARKRSSNLYSSILKGC